MEKERFSKTLILHCFLILYNRSVNRFDLLALVDIDEFIMPTNDTNLTSLMQRTLKDSPNFGSFVFKNVFHYVYWDNTTELLEKHWKKHEGEILPYLLTQTKLRRTSQPNKNGQRSKYLIRPEHVTMIGNHQVWKLINGE